MVTLHTHLVMVTSYRGGAISRNQMIFNKRMSAVRICVDEILLKPSQKIKIKA
jgi:hypothetical protein